MVLRVPLRAKRRHFPCAAGELVYGTGIVLSAYHHCRLRGSQPITDFTHHRHRIFAEKPLRTATRMWMTGKPISGAALRQPDPCVGAELYYIQIFL